MRRVDRYMQRALSTKIFPGAVLLVRAKGSIEFFEAYGWANLVTKEKMMVNTIFDLASLTKPLATALAVMTLMAESRMALTQCLGEILPWVSRTPKAAITIEMLLRHTSGYPAHREYYKALHQMPYGERKEKMYSLLAAEPLEHAIGQTTVYSDLGFMVLAEAVKKVAEKDLDQWLAETVYTPLGLSDLYFVRHFERLRSGRYAATEFCPFRHELLSGVVHDDNAYAMGGVCGHAGLFGTAEDVMQLLRILLESYKGGTGHAVFSPQLVRLFFKRPSKDGRPLGFDAPTYGASTSGTRFSRQSVGHLGFTGTSFWVDLQEEIIVVLLTNRVHPNRDNDAIKQFRPMIHDAIMEALGK
jgi:CubicO group peptidase (beta-lactamase class C family)